MDERVHKLGQSIAGTFGEDTVYCLVTFGKSPREHLMCALDDVVQLFFLG